MSSIRWVLRGCIRYARLLIDLIVLNGRIPNPIHICISIDFDLKTAVRAEKGVEIIESLLGRFGLTGRATYLINPNPWLGDESPIYKEMLTRGYEVGLHTHAETMIHEEQDGVPALIAEQKAKVERCLRQVDPHFQVQSFRSGCRVVSPLLFRSLARLGIRYDSSLGHFDRARTIFGFQVVDTGTPDRAYYLDSEDPKTESVAPTPIVEIPVTSQIPELRRLSRSLRKDEPLIVATFVHPFNFQRAGRPNWLFIAFYWFVLFCVTRIKNARFDHLSAAGRSWESWYCEQHARQSAPLAERTG